ncbi:hypothetical protein CLF_107502, partial [Clonorchis sinensis]
MTLANNSTLMPHRPSRGAISRVALLAAYSRTGPSSRTDRFARPASHLAADCVRPSSLTTLNTSKSVFKPRKPVYLATFNIRSPKQAGQQVALARTLDSLSIDVCCLSETRTQVVLAFPAQHRCLAVRLLSQRLWLRTLIVLLSRTTMTLANNSTLMPHRPSRGAISRVALLAAYSRTGPSSRTDRFARPASHLAADCVRPSSLTTLNTSKSVFKPRKPVYLATFNIRSPKQAGQQVALARTLDSLSIDVCCLSETRTQDASVSKTRKSHLAIEIVEPEVKRKYHKCLSDGTMLDINGHWEKISRALLKVGTSVCGTTQPTSSKHWISDRTVSLLETRRQIPPGHHHNSTQRIIRHQVKL